MEASVSQDGAQTTAAPEAPAQEAPQQQSAVPENVSQRLDEISGTLGEFQPLLQQLQEQQQPQEEPQPGMDQFVEPETGYVIDPEGLQNFINQQAEQQAREMMTPYEQRVAQMEQRALGEDFADLRAQFPQLADETYLQKFVPQVEAAAHRYAQALGLGQAEAQRLAINPDFVANQYLAGLAREQAAQPGVPAGDQVHLEGGSAVPGQPEVDPKQSWLALGQGASNGPFGNVPVDQL